jgi:SAM-dependent methyltransferase
VCRIRDGAQRTGNPESPIGNTAGVESSPMPAIHGVSSTLAEVSSPNRTTEFTIKLTPFDQRQYRRLIATRAETIRRVVGKLKPVLSLTTALDAGCGVGFFSKTLEECGLNVCAFDGRAENVVEARKRFPSVPFETADIEDRNTLELGRFDFVLCCGLIYHLENPLLAIRNLRALTGKCLLLESMCIPDKNPLMLLREEPRADDQSLTDIACYPSEGSLVKMLYRSGFPAVYRVTPLPQHDDFQDTPDHERYRGISAIPGTARSARSMEQGRTRATQRRKALQTLPGKPDEKEICHDGATRAANFSGGDDSVAASVRSLVAGGEGRSGSRAHVWRIRGNRDAFCRAAPAAGNDRPGYRSTPWFVHVVGGETSRKTRKSDRV